MTSTLAAPSSRSLHITLTGLAVGLYWVSLYLYVPTLPVYATTRTADVVMVGTILAQYGLWQAVVRLPLGIFADWSGRRRVFILLGFALAALGAWMMGSATGAAGLLVGRAVTGLSASAWLVMVVAFSSLFPPGEAVKATAILTIVNSGARMLATLVTGTLNDLGGYPLAFTLAAAAAGLAVVFYLPVHEQKYPAKRFDLAATRRLVTRRDVLLPAVLNALLMYVSYSTTFGFIPILAKEFGASNPSQSLLASLNIGLSVLGHLLAARLSRTIPGRVLAGVGFVLTVTGLGLAWGSTSLAWVFIAQAVYGLGYGIVYPTLMGMSIEYVDGTQRATAAGLHQGVYAIGMFAGPWLSGILVDSIGLQPMFGLTAAGVLVLAALGISQCQEKLIKLRPSS